jgi:hypothetical protein
MAMPAIMHGFSGSVFNRLWIGFEAIYTGYRIKEEYQNLGHTKIIDPRPF